VIEMNRTVRAVLGIIAIGVLFFVVVGFWNQYRAAGEDPTAASAGQESTPAAEGDAAKSDQGDSKPEEAKPASKNTAEPKKGDKIVVVQIQGLNFRKEPKPDSEPIRGLDEGDTLIYIDTQGSWYRVKDSQGTEGYVSASDQYTKLETAQ